MSPTLSPASEELLKNHQPRVIVKFDSRLKLPYEDGAEKALFSQKSVDWEALSKSFPGLRLKKIFDPETEKEYRYLTELAKAENKSEEVPNLFAYFYVEAANGTDTKLLIDTLLKNQMVITAYQEGIWLPAGPNPGDLNPRSGQQGYLDPAPTGIDARFTQQLLNGDGFGIKVAHIDQGWLLNHEDLYRPANPIVRIPNTSTQYSDEAHGIAVLGIMAANNNQTGIAGIVPNATFGVAGNVFGGLQANYAALAYSTMWCRNTPGSIILITSLLQTYANGNHHYIPVESELMVFDAIRFAAVNHKICVVEAAGQYIGESRGGINLDDYRNERGNQIYNRTVRDSGAIMVAASSLVVESDSSISHTRWNISNYGNRIDCFAWGEKITTTGSDETNRNGYTDTFGGTSGAAAIVAGAAVAIQSLAKSFRREGIFLPSELRAMLSDRLSNTPSKTPREDKIGVMPNLKRIAEQYDLVHYPVLLNPEAENHIKRMREILAFAWQFLGPYGSDGFDKIIRLPGEIIVRIPKGGIPKGPFATQTLEIINAMALIEQSTQFGKEEALTIRKIGLENIKRAVEAIEKVR